MAVESKGVDAMARETVDILSRKADSAFDSFIAALHSTGQQHVATILRPDSSSIPMSDEHREILTQKLADVSSFLDPESGLRNKLISSGLFTVNDDCRVNTQDYTSQELISMLMRKSDSAFRQFIDLLKETGQEHVAYILTGEGHVPPLSRLRLQILQQERQNLIERIDSENSLLIDKLFADGVLNASEKERITAETTNYRKNRVLLDTVSRKYQSAYDMFLQALKDVGQEHIATDLEGIELRGIVDPHFGAGTLTSSHRRNVMHKIIDKLNNCTDPEVDSDNEIHGAERVHSV